MSISPNNFVLFNSKQPSITVPTYNKHISHNKHTLFALTKMCLF